VLLVWIGVKSKGHCEQC